MRASAACWAQYSRVWLLSLLLVIDPEWSMMSSDVERDGAAHRGLRSAGAAAAGVASVAATPVAPGPTRDVVIKRTAPSQPPCGMM